MIDPQLDSNVLIQILANIPEFVAYALAKQADGLENNEATVLEFLAMGTQSDLNGLARKYGIIQNIAFSINEIDDTANRRHNAFLGDPLGRNLHDQDARVASTVFLKNEILATGDIQLFQRIRDLGMRADFIGSRWASLKAQANCPRPVKVPPS